MTIRSLSVGRPGADAVVLHREGLTRGAPPLEDRRPGRRAGARGSVLGLNENWAR